MKAETRSALAEAAGNATASVVLATPPGQAAVAGATVLAVAAAPLVALVSIAGCVIVGTFVGLTKLEEIVTGK